MNNDKMQNDEMTMTKISDEEARRVVGGNIGRNDIVFNINAACPSCGSFLVSISPDGKTCTCSVCGNKYNHPTTYAN